MSDSLLEFLRTGKLGPLWAGMSASELDRALGAPNAKATGGQLLLYGCEGIANVQVPLVDQQVTGIWVYFWGEADVSSIPAVLGAKDWKVNGRTTIAEYTRLMDAEGIAWRRLATLSFEDQTCIMHPSGVHSLWSHDPTVQLQKILLSSEMLNPWDSENGIR